MAQTPVLERIDPEFYEGVTVELPASKRRHRLSMRPKRSRVRVGSKRDD